MIKDIFLEAGFPNNIFNNLQIPSSLVSKVIEHNQIQGVAITGSTNAGKAVAKIASENLKKTVLELGGNDPYLILEDAEIDHAIKACIESRLLNNGQSCISAKRLIVTKNNIDSFTKKLIDNLDLKVMGDPYDDVDYGPLVSLSAREEIHKMVKSSIKIFLTDLDEPSVVDLKSLRFLSRESITCPFKMEKTVNNKIYFIISNQVVEPDGIEPTTS